MIVLVFAMMITGCGVISFSLGGPEGDKGNEKTTIAGQHSSPDSIMVVAGPEYAAGGFHRFFWGDHYRDEWTTPFAVEILDLGTFGGGLTPVKRGGGYQTKSLRFKGNDGRFYSFRSINKDPTKALPAELRQTFAGDILQDQISSSHPAAVLIVDVLADALGVLHPKPMLCLMPDDERLGEFRDDFAGVLGTIEDYPADGPDGGPGFGESTKIVSTLKLFENLDKNSDDMVNAPSLLAARLLDILVGDWDRHIDQWRWARFEEGRRDVWYPVPRDRDQAFARLDGIVPSLGATAITQVEGFGESFPKIEDLTFSGRYLDRRFLVHLDRNTWDSVTTSVIARLTDDVLERAIDRVPQGMKQTTHWILSGLKSRREKLRQASREYYLSLADFVDIRLSDKAEYISVSRMDDDSTEVVAYKRDKKSGGSEGAPVFRRTFHRDETTEIRLYLLGGDDKAVVTGTVRSGITVRIIGGEGDDELVDESYVKGSLFGFVPLITTAARATFFYDDTGNNTIIAGSGTVVDTDRFESTMVASQQY